MFFLTHNMLLLKFLKKGKALLKRLNKFGFFVSKVDLQTLVKYLQNTERKVDIAIFKRDLVKKLN